MTTKMNEDFDIEDKFDPNAYRQSLKERLGIANLPTTKLKDLNRVDVPSPAISKATEEIRTPELIPATMEDAQAPQAVGQVPGQVAGASEVGAEAEVNNENLAPAQAILDTFMMSAAEQSHNAKDTATRAMLMQFHNYLHGNSAKICKDMMKAAGK